MANEFSKSRASAGALSFAQAENLADIKTFSLRTSQQKQVEQNRKLIDEYYQEQNKPKDNGGFFGGIGYAFEKLGLGFLQSIEGIWDFTAGGLADLFGAHDWAEQQIANDWVNYGHADEWFNPSDGWKVAGDVAGGIGTSIPALSAIAVGAAITYFSGGAASPIAVQLITGATAGLIAGLGAAGTATKEAYNETGQLTGKEWGYGALSGFTEGAMEGVTDAIGFGAGTIVKSFTASAAKEGAKQVGKQVAKSVARQTLGKAMIKGFIGEAFEEGVQELIDPVWKRLTYDPNAENATFQQVAYAALVGGLSGAIMSGADVSIRNSINYFSGSKTTANGGAKGVIDLATTIAETEGVNQSGNAQVDFVVNTLNELQESLTKTNGEVKTAKQKMIVGILSKANTAAPLSIVVHQNADAIIADAETTVKRLNDIGYKTSKGEAVTVEMLKQGVTGERGTTEYRRSLSVAMRTNEALRDVAVMSAAGQLNMDAARFRESTLRGENLFNRADLNHFVETATEAQKRDVGERLGITDWATVTAEELKSRIVEFSKNGGLDQYINERNEVKKLGELEISKKGLPKYVGFIKQDGAVRYKFGDASVAIVKNGDTYLVYDYARDIISKPLTKTEANRVIKEIYAASVTETGSDVQTLSQQQTQEIDTFARENVPDYKNLVGAQQQAVRQTLRQARAAGVSEADQILYASVAARSGVNIEFVSAEDMRRGEYSADAGYRMKDGSILINREIANNPNARTAAKILLHEFTHSIIGARRIEGHTVISNPKAFREFIAIAVKGLSDEQQIKIITPYVDGRVINGKPITIQDFLDGKVKLSKDAYIELMTELNEELAAHFVERELGNSAALKRIISDKPSFKDKLLSFLKRSKSDYSSNEKLSRASNALLKKYQNFFNKYATQNRFSPTITGDLSTYQSTEAADTDTGTRLAMSETFNRLGRYTDSEIASIEATKIYQVAKTYNDIQEFIDSALNGRQEQRLFLGKVTAATAAKIYKATGLDVKGKSIALSSSDIRHIFNGHSNVNAEALSGQIAITKSNFENIIETVIEPDEVGRSDANGVVGIVFKKEIDGKITAVTILSEKKKTLTLKSAWITKEKQATSLTLDVQAPSLTSKTGQRIKPVTDSISKKTKNVNPNGKKRYALSETDSETRTLTDEQRRFFQNSKITDNKGRLLVLYHQTDAEFTVFDTSRDGAGMRDNETPHGIFMKPTAENIGLKGNKQMPLYANITNPLRFVDRAQAQKYWRANIEGYASIIDEITANDTKYNAEFEEAFNLERVARRKNLDWKKLNESQQDSLFWESERESERILKEWETANIALDKQAKKLIDAYLKTSGYDGVLVEHDAGSMGRSVKTIIALEPNQVKSINNYTPTKSSDIRFALTSDTQTFDRFANVKEARKYYDNAIAEAYKRYRKVDPLRMRTTTDEKAAFDRYLSEMAALESEKASVVKAVKKRISSTDSAGRSLTPKQIKWASGTKVVDANGHIKAVYHGTGAQFNEFSYDYLGKNGTSYGKGFYFSDSAEYSSGYVSGDGRLMEVYLSIKKPLNATKLTMSRAQVRSFLSALAKYKTVDGISPLSDYADIDSYGINSAINAALDLEMDSNNNDVDIVHSIYNSIAGIELQDYYKILKDTLGFDGIIEHRDSENFYIIFSSNQAKNVTNTAPTESADIRYALPETDSTGKKLSEQQRRFFNDSKIVDKQGRLLSVYHGSPRGGFTVFDTKYDGAYFTPDKQYATEYTRNGEFGNTPKVYEVYLNIQNPFDTRNPRDRKLFYDEFYMKWGNGTDLQAKGLPDWTDGSDLVEFLRDKGYDGMLIDEGGVPDGKGGVRDRGISYVAFSPEQIKQTTNLTPTTSDDIRFALDMSKRQDKTSAATSINSAKLPVLYGKVDFKTGTVNLDIGGGRFDNVTDYLAAKGVKNYIYDPYNRSAEHNAAVAKVTQEGQSDTVTISNVLNVIDSLDGRRQVLENAVDAVKPDGTVYITVYEGDGSGVARNTGKDQFQLNRKTADYVAEVQEFFDDVTVKNKVIIAKSPKKAISGIRYALSDTDINPTESDNSGAIGGLSRGQRAKFVANNTKFKVYSKLDATSVIDSIVAERLTLRDGQFEGVLSGKSRAEVIEKLFTKLNSTPEGYRIGVALNIADYIIDNAVLTDMYDTFNDDSYAMGVLSVMRRYMHRMNLSGIQGEIQHRFDRKNSINLVWGAKQDGVSPDVVAQELQSYGIQIDAINEADQFFEMLELYEGAKEQVNKRTEKVMLTAIGSEAEIEKLRQQIARDVLLAYDEKGTPSKYAKLVEKYTKRIADLKKDLSTAYKRNTLTNRIIDGAAYLRDVATKRNYVGAEIFSAPELTQWLKQLSKIKYRSDLRKTGVRKILLDYGLFYNTNNALLYDENPDLSYIDNNVIDALNFIRQNALSTKPLSMEELQAAEIIIASAKHLFNNYDQIIIEGKKAKISELATEGNEIIKKSKNRTNKTFFNKIYGVFNKIIEPRVVIKSLENFNPNGILTRAYAEVTRGETEAGLLYIELTNDIDTYIKKHKRFKNRLTSEYITVAGAELTVGQAISLYELSKRTQAQEGLYESGFSYIDKKGSKQTAHITEADITAMYDAFTDTDKGFIELVETFFNVLSKQVKTDADMEILGYTNASEDFYFPIKRDSSTIAKNITDARSIMADWANVYNFSFNKDVKTGAKNKLFVTDVYSIVTRHAKQLSTYAKMTVPLKNFSQIYAKNIGDKTNVVSIRNTINEQVWGGAEGYLSKLFSDIQGRATSNSIIEKMRGAYAKYQLGANLKVIVSQITSYPTAGIMLDSGVMAKGFVMRTNWAAMDKYCPYARVRNYERGIVRAEGVVDKIGKVGDVLTKPIQWTDRFTIGRLWNACQLQVQKDTGLKYGTVENMQKTGDMLEEVIRLTQPNYTNTERSELMRSDSDIVRSFTMFTSVPLKQLSRLVESFGEYNALRSLIKSGDSDPTLSKRYKLAKKKIRRTLASVTIANLMYVLVGQFFKFLYNNMAEDDEEGKVTAKSFFLDMLKDFGSTTIGMLPVVRDIYGYFVNGYEIESFTGDMLNSIISSAKSLFELATKAASGEEIKTQEYMSIFRNSLYSIGQVTGIPVRNINNTITGLVRRFSPSAAYAYTSLFYNPKYSSDIRAALKKGDYDLAETIMGMLLKDGRTGGLNEKATKKLIELYDAGYTVLPKSIGDTLTYNGEEIRLTAAQQSSFRKIYSQANAEIEAMVNSAEFASLPAEKQARAIKLLYDAYYSKAQASVLKLASDNKIIMLSSAIPPSALAPHLSAISAIESDTDKKGNVISGSKKAKVIKYVLAQKLSTPQKLLLILSLGYTIKDGDIRGVTALKAKRVVARYITNLKLSREEKTALAEKCGLTVKNGRIYAK